MAFARQIFVQKDLDLIHPTVVKTKNKKKVEKITDKWEGKSEVDRNGSFQDSFIASITWKLQKWVNYAWEERQSERRVQRNEKYAVEQEMNCNYLWMAMEHFERFKLSQRGFFAPAICGQKKKWKL